MKRALSLITTVSVFFLFSCDRPKEEIVNNTAEPIEPAAMVEEENPKPAVCLWKEVAIRETPTEKGKYKTSIYLGENLMALTDTATDMVKDRKVIYRKVELTDGAQGWVREDFIAIDGKSAAFLREAAVYKRPDIMTTSGKSFSPMDFVAIKSIADGGWAEVVGKRIGDSWFSSGWVKLENLTTNDVDVAFSVFYAKAMEQKDESKRAVEFSKLVDNTDLNASVFRAALVEQMQDQADEEMQEEVVVQ